MRVWVTRDEPPGGDLSRALAAEGLEVVLEPVVRRRVLGDAHAELAGLGPSDWLVLTSAYVLQCIAVEAAAHVRVAAVGPHTAEVARRAGLRVEMTAESGGAETLFAELRQRVPAGSICYPRSSRAHAPAAWKPVTIISPVVYDTSPRAFDRSVMSRTDVATVTSPSAAEALVGVTLPLASIGPTTSAAIRHLGLHLWLEAPQASFESLARAIAQA